jgi:hypothetical protein
MARRVIRRSTLDRAYSTVLADIPPEMHQTVRAYAENMRAGQEIRSELTSMMTRHGVKWWQVDDAASRLCG